MDITIAFLEIAKRIAIYHIIPALILSATTLLLVLGIIRLCRVQRPSVRGAIFFIALLKPLFVLIQGTSPASHKIYTSIALSLQLPDPMDFIPTHLWHTELEPDFQLVDINMSISLILILLLAGLFLFWRWRSYYLFCQKVSRESSVKQKEKQELSAILTRLQEKISTPARLLITRTEYDSPFSVGVRNPVMVFPSYILAHLTPREKEAVLAHELIHIYQRDTIRQWLPVILKDLVN